MQWPYFVLSQMNDDMKILLENDCTLVEERVKKHSDELSGTVIVQKFIIFCVPKHFLFLLFSLMAIMPIILWFSYWPLIRN